MFYQRLNFLIFVIISFNQVTNIEAANLVPSPLMLCNRLLSEKHDSLINTLAGNQAYQIVKSLRKNFPRDRDLFLYEMKEKTLAEIIETEEARKKIIVEVLDEFVADPSLSEVQRQGLRETQKNINKIHFTFNPVLPESLMHHHLWEVQSLWPGSIYHQTVKSLSDLISKPRALLAELEVELMIPNLSHFRAKGEEIIPETILEKLYAMSSKPSWRKKILVITDFEMDAIYKNGQGWVEVKSAMKSQNYAKKEIIDRAKRRASIIKHLNNVGWPVTLEYVFIGAKPTPSLRKELEDLGFSVYYFP